VLGILRQTKTISASRITQDIILYGAVPRIDFKTEIAWGNEKDVLLKVAFPVDILSDKAVYDIQFGSVERPTHWNRPSDLAMFEVCGHKWADLSEGDYGVSLLNDCKYGYDIKGHEMRLTLLRASGSPDPEADINRNHVCTYSLYPHEGDYTQSTVRQGYELNVPPTAVCPPDISAGGARRKSFLSVDSRHIIIDTVKKCEHDNAWIIRLYEAHKTRGSAVLRIGMEPSAVYETDLMERVLREVPCREGSIAFDYKPFEILTFKVEI
jgi:alpha-mannosidase